MLFSLLIPRSRDRPLRLLPCQDNNENASSDDVTVSHVEIITLRLNHCAAYEVIFRLRHSRGAQDQRGWRVRGNGPRKKKGDRMRRMIESSLADTDNKAGSPSADTLTRRGSRWSFLWISWCVVRVDYPFDGIFVAKCNGALTLLRPRSSIFVPVSASNFHTEKTR